MLSKVLHFLGESVAAPLIGFTVEEADTLETIGFMKINSGYEMMQNNISFRIEFSNKYQAYMATLKSEVNDLEVIVVTDYLNQLTNGGKLITTVKNLISKIETDSAKDLSSKVEHVVDYKLVTVNQGIDTYTKSK